MRRERLRLLAVAAVAVGGIPLAALPGSAPASASAPLATAYYVKLGTPVPTVPKGGLLVGADATNALGAQSPIGSQLPVPVTTPPGVQRGDVLGPTAMSALRITGVGATVDVTLTLRVATGSLPPPPSAVTIVACTLVQPLTPPATSPGDIASAPAFDCSNTSTGRVAGDDSSISWLLPSSFQFKPGELDVALLPDPNGNPVPFSTAFSAPGPSAVEASTGPAAVPLPTRPEAAPVPSAAPSASPSSSPSFTPSLGSVGVSFPGELPAAGVGAQAPVPVPAPTPARASAPSLVTAPALASVHLPGDGRAHRIVAVGLLFAITLAWWYVGSQPTRPPRKLGPLAGAEPASSLPVQMGGIGRFRRPRTAVRARQ